MKVALTEEAWAALLREYCVRAPGLLAMHPSTAPLALEIERQRLADALETHFAVAVVGQMRVGKSTLINALLEADLAPTGVTETTATVNVFRFGTGPDRERFRVFWRDGSVEERPLSDIGGWIGSANNAARTSRIEFLSDTPFLRTATLIDTPGTRSVLDVHEAAARAAWVGEADGGWASGGRADAVVYAINPVVRTGDDELLRLFGEASRLPGASPSNSVAVMQKWEDLGEDPFAEAERRADRIRSELSGRVAEVLPTSGLLALVARHTPPALLDQVARLAVGASAQDFDDLRSGPEFFVDELSDGCLDVAARRRIAKAIPWPALRLALFVSRRGKIDDGAALRTALLHASGIDRLRDLLTRRFFANAALIKAHTALRKAGNPCAIGLGRLRQLTEQRGRLRAEGMVCAATLGADPASQATRRYVDRSIEALDGELSVVNGMLRELDGLHHRVIENFQALTDDLGAMEALAALPNVPAARRAAFRALFGAGGMGIGARLGFADLNPSSDALSSRATELLTTLAREAQVPGPLRAVAQHACARLNQILDTLEEP